MRIINVVLFIFLLTNTMVFSDEVESAISKEERLVLGFIKGIESGEIPLDSLPREEDIITELIGRKKDFFGDPRVLLRDFLVGNKSLFLADDKINNKSTVFIKPLYNLSRFEIMVLPQNLCGI